ncbi:MAG TPA: response regulator [Planctomycetota bacterium]|jgi:YD repeat-containing protein
MSLPHEENESQSEGAFEDAPSRRVLVIDDDVDSADTLALLLQAAGHTVSQTYDGASALKAARDFRPEIIISDITLKGQLDGYAVARAVRQNPDTKHVFLVALSGFGQHEDKRRASEAGFDVHLTKPTDPAALELIVAEMRAK